MFVVSNIRMFNNSSQYVTAENEPTRNKMRTKSGMDNKITRTLRHRMTAVVLILLSAIFIPDQTTAATSAKPSKTGFGWRYEYDTRGRITSITNPANKKTKIRYTQNRKGGLSGMTQKLPDGSRVKFEFDKYGRRTKMVDSAGTVHYVYDKFGHLTKVHREGTPAISYGYDTLDRIKLISIGTRFTLLYAYDFRGRPEKITTPVGNIRFSYNSKTGAVVRRLPNGISTRWVHQPDGRLESITHTSSGSRSLAQYQYTYRLDGLITSIKELTTSGVQTRRYHYDTAQRLVSVSGARQPKIAFAYDKLGNRTKLRRHDRNPISAQYDWAGRLTRYDGQLCQHDPAGNLTSCTGSSKTFTFDDTGLLKIAVLKNGNINYRYDGDGYLISRSNGASRQNFLPDPLSDIWQPLAVKGPGGQQTFYIWVGASPLMAITGKQVRYFLHDHLGSVRLVTDRRGDILERLDYTPFGQMEREPAGADLQPGFAGLFFDKSASVYLTRARAYDPELGRFLQPDPEHRVPTGSQKDLSVYAYCGGDPVNFIDLDGARPAWSTFGYWSAGAKLLFNPTSAKKWYAAASERSLNQAGQTGATWAGAKATFFDLAGGYIPGEHYNRGQKLATVAWSLAGGLGSAVSIGYRQIVQPGAARTAVLGGIGLIRNIASPFVKASEGNTRGAVGDIALMGYGKAAKVLSAKPFNLLTNDLTRSNLFLGRGLKKISDGMKIVKLAYSYGKKPRDVWKAYSPHSAGGGDSNSYSGLTSARGSYSSTRYRETFSGAAFNKSYAEFERTGVYRDPFKANNNSGLNQSKVGGIRLTGAGNALSHLGGLEGIALDETNDRLILIGKGERPINLPPLRLDDVVTIFRSVYKHGEAPSVSIDPLSDKKTEKWMKVRHGAATENTYVGWVLYEADRIMKNYGLGKDNKTKKKIYSKVPGYMDFNRIGSKSRKPQWERFWIVPASLTRTQGKTSELTMFDIPLKLETEKMEWNGTKLVTARSPTPSRSAVAYTTWFTSQYDKIAKEVKIRPPKHFGFEHPVAVYEELRRIALITGIAETLRDQNVPFPSWMNDYPVKPCISDRKTPVLRVKGEGYEVTGGVQLAANDKNIRTLKGDNQVSQLAEIIRHKMASKPLFAPVSFQQKGKTYKAVAIPGADTRRSGANILRHTDLTAPVLQDAGIQLTRHFNSFYEPRGMFGRGWTLDLPKLESQRQPVSRTESSISYKTVYQLSSPLNSWSERFAEIRPVPELNSQLMVPTTSGEMLGLADSNLRIIGQKTKELIFRDGGSWHFDTDGYLVARSDKKTMVIYQRDKNHRISSIKSRNLQGNRVSSGKPDAELRLAYDDKGNRVRSIEARSPKLGKPIKALYFYDKAGQLVMVVGTDGKSEYAYRNGLVVSITKDDERLATFEYNEQGQLQKEKRADGKKVTYKRTSTSYGTKVVAMDAGSQKPLETVEYDANFRPLRRIFDDGSKIAWDRQDKALETTITQPDGEYYTVTESNDGRHSSLKTSAGEVYTADFDAAGRVTRAHLEGGPTLEQKWRANGRLQSAISDEQGVLPSYSRDGKLTCVIVTPPDQARTQQIREYVKTEYDAQERVTSVTDDSGSQLQIGYDKSGQPSVIRSQRGTVTIDRDTKGQVTQVGTTWGLTEKYDYDKKTGSLSRITLQQQQAGISAEQASIELIDGRISKVRLLDGGETTLNYYQNGKQKGFLKKVHTTEKLVLAYSYDDSARLTGIDIGDSNDPAYRVNYIYDTKGRLTGILYKPTSGR
jgi:RHS repeat-associated protein